jgi:hypothetical protein
MSYFSPRALSKPPVPTFLLPNLILELHSRHQRLAIQLTNEISAIKFDIYLLSSLELPQYHFDSARFAFYHKLLRWAALRRIGVKVVCQFLSRPVFSRTNALFAPKLTSFSLRVVRPGSASSPAFKSSSLTQPTETSIIASGHGRFHSNSFMTYFGFHMSSTVIYFVFEKLLFVCHNLVRRLSSSQALNRIQVKIFAGWLSSRHLPGLFDVFHSS